MSAISGTSIKACSRRQASASATDDGVDLGLAAAGDTMQQPGLEARGAAQITASTACCSSVSGDARCAMAVFEIWGGPAALQRQPAAIGVGDA